MKGQCILKRQFTAKSINSTSLTKFLVLPAYRVFHLSIVSFNLAPSTLDLTTTCFRSVHKDEIFFFKKVPLSWGGNVHLSAYNLQIELVFSPVPSLDSSKH